jgi:hypothetical protein
MKKIAALIVVFSLLALPAAVGAQTTTNTAFQVVNLSSTTDADVTITYYDTNGTVIYTADDTIVAGSSETYVQASMGTELGEIFNGSVVIASSQEIAAIVNQSTTGDSIYNGSYTGFSQGSTTFYLPVVLNNFYGWKTEVSVQNASSAPVDVTIEYSTAGCTDVKTALAVGAAVRFDNTATCTGGLDGNGSGTISATGPVVAVVNQISVNGNKEQSYNGFAPTDGASTLYTPIALRQYYTFNSAFQIQNISNDPMDITATYSDGYEATVSAVAPGASATFQQAGETAHGTGWTGSAVITNDTGGAMVGIVNQASPGGKASSFNMFSAGAAQWALPSLLYQYYGGYNSAFQVQNISSGAINCDVLYSDAVTASATDIPANGVATFTQRTETGHVTRWAGSAIVTCTGNAVIVVNQDAPASVDKQYSYNGVPLQ